MRNVNHILSLKTAVVYRIAAHASVYEALLEMTAKDISALLIMEDELLLGIFTERDYARKIILQGKSSKETLVKEAMTPSPIVVNPAHSIEDCMEIMSEKHIRHLPVMDEYQRVIGMVSIGDVVKYIIADQKQTISQLENYINS